MKEKILIRLEHNYSPSFEGLDEMVLELEKKFIIQRRQIWMASASEGEEIWIQVFINAKAIDFILAAVSGGLIYDIIKTKAKEFIIKPLFKQLDILADKTDCLPRVRTFKFEFDDITIKIYGLHSNYTSIIGMLFQSLSTVIPKLHSKGITNISAINLPIIEQVRVDELELQYDIFNESKDYRSYLKIWEVISGFGCIRHLYYLENEELKEFYDKIY